MPELIRNLWQLKTAVFLHWCLLRVVPLDSWSNFGDVLSFHFSQEQMSENVVEEFRVVVTGSLAVRAPVDLEDLRGHGSLLRIIPRIRRKHFFSPFYLSLFLYRDSNPRSLGCESSVSTHGAIGVQPREKGKWSRGTPLSSFVTRGQHLSKFFFNLLYW